MRWVKVVSVALLALSVVAQAPTLVAQRPAATALATPTDPRDPQLNQGPKPESIGDKAMVSTQLPIVSQTALQVLREGGNAVDAMITAVFLQHVVDYHQVSHFGAMSAIGYDAKTNAYWAINAVSQRPRGDRGADERGDPKKVAIGGVVRGLEALAKKYGTKPWSSYLQPAIKAAEEGVIVTSFMYGNNYTLWSQELLDNKDATVFYMPEGHLVPVGGLWKMPAFAATLRKVAEQGADYLYTGEWGQKFVKEANKRGGRVTAQDLAEYQPIWDEPVRFTYRGHTIYGSPAPDTGGPLVGYNLNVLENFDLKKLGPYTQSAETLEIMARALGKGEAETRGAIRDPLNYQLPIALWLSKDYGRMGAEFVRSTMPKTNLAPATETSDVAWNGSMYSAGVNGDDGELGSNHDVIADGQGNWISLLHTGHGGAPGVHIDGVRATGSTAYADTVGPGRRLVLPITAIIIAGKDGKPWMAMGTPGSPPQPVTQVIVNILDFGMHPKDAADAPRFWAFRNAERVLEIESRITEDTRKGLAARGIRIKNLGPYNWHTGSFQIVWRDEAGKLHGVTDPRRLGVAAGF